MKARSRRAELVAILGGAAVLVAAPFLTLAFLPDAPAPARIAPYIEWGRRNLVIQHEPALFAAHHLRYVGARCTGNSVALLFELRVYPFLTTEKAWVANADWPPADARFFSGAFSVDDYDASLREDVITDQPWGSCEPA